MLPAGIIAFESMPVTVNGEIRQIPAGSNIAALLADLAITGRLAVELNGAIVPRSEFETRSLNAGDTIEIVRAIGGG